MHSRYTYLAVELVSFAAQSRRSMSKKAFQELRAFQPPPVLSPLRNLGLDSIKQAMSSACVKQERWALDALKIWSHGKHQPLPQQEQPPPYQQGRLQQEHPQQERIRPVLQNVSRIYRPTSVERRQTNAPRYLGRLPPFQQQHRLVSERFCLSIARLVERQWCIRAAAALQVLRYTPLLSEMQRSLQDNWVSSYSLMLVNSIISYKHDLMQLSSLCAYRLAVQKEKQTRALRLTAVCQALRVLPFQSVFYRWRRHLLSSDDKEKQPTRASSPTTACTELSCSFLLRTVQYLNESLDAALDATSTEKALVLRHAVDTAKLVVPMLKGGQSENEENHTDSARGNTAARAASNRRSVSLCAIRHELPTPLRSASGAVASYLERFQQKRRSFCEYIPPRPKPKPLVLTGEQLRQGAVFLEALQQYTKRMTGQGGTPEEMPPPVSPEESGSPASVATELSCTERGATIEDEDALIPRQVSASFCRPSKQFTAAQQQEQKQQPQLRQMLLRSRSFTKGSPWRALGRKSVKPEPLLASSPC